jgi:hypothetical protein
LDLINPSTGNIFTAIPTEPILAYATMAYPCKQPDWPKSIKTFFSNLLSQGAINKGRKGELFT